MIRREARLSREDAAVSDFCRDLHNRGLVYVDLERYDDNPQGRQVFEMESVKKGKTASPSSTRTSRGKV